MIAGGVDNQGQHQVSLQKATPKNNLALLTVCGAAYVRQQTDEYIKTVLSPNSPD